MLEFLRVLFRSRNTYINCPVALPRLLITEKSVYAMKECMGPEIERGHEGINYLLGRITEQTTLVLSVIRPAAETTEGSFYVGSSAMSRVVRVASQYGLQVVGQVHTHPNFAYHSKGDNEGARIAYCGYVSIVLPDYGRRLPCLEGSATYLFENDEFARLESDEIVIIPSHF